MPKPNFLKDIADQLAESLPNHLESLRKDFTKNCQSILTSAFQKLDLVTREEFDTQMKVLQRSRKKLEQLEKTVKHLEELLKRSKSK